jgi:hypothetical protein
VDERLNQEGPVMNGAQAVSNRTVPTPALSTKESILKWSLKKSIGIEQQAPGEARKDTNRHNPAA